MFRISALICLLPILALAQSAGTISLSSAAVELDAPEAGFNDLGYRFMLADTVSVTCGGEAWTPNEDYWIDHNGGRIYIVREGPYPAPVTVSFEFIPFFQEEKFEDVFAGADEAAALERLQYEGSDTSLDVTGSKTFTVTAGTDEAADLQQSLRLSIKGKVGSSTRITAELSDQTIPFEEGAATQNVAELDQVYVNVAGKNYEATFGDLEIERSGRRYADFERRLIGLEGELNFPGYGVIGGVARTRGRFAEVEFNGRDGVQGPYPLSVGGDESIVVLAGTEKVWLNGKALKPGDNNDYTFDYDLARITFTGKRIIDNDDRMVVEFQYYTEDYKRDFWISEGELHLFDGSFNASLLFVGESDSIKDPPFAPTKDELYRLERAGDDADRAFTFANDEDGNPIYEFVGAGNGDYTREWDNENGEYVYTDVGSGNGDFTPRRVDIPLPVRHNLTDFTFEITPFNLLTVTGEMAVSEKDGNLYSIIDDDNNAGSAGEGRFTLHVHRLVALRDRFDDLTITGYAAAREESFAAIAAADGADFAYGWDIDGENAGLTRRPGYEEYGGVASVAIAPLTASAEVGRLEMRYPRLSNSGYRYLNMNRVRLDVALAKNPVANATYYLNNIIKTGIRGSAATDIADDTHGTDSGGFREQRGGLSRRIWILEPFLDGYERTRTTDTGDDGGLDRGDRLIEAGGGCRFYPMPGMELTGSHTESWGDTVSGGGFSRSYRSKTEHADLNYDIVETLNLYGDYTHIKKDYLAAGSSDVISDIGELNLLLTPFERMITSKARYVVEGAQNFEQEEYFERADSGDGDYRREDDPEHPGRYVYIYDPDHPEAYYLRKFRNTGLVVKTIEADLSGNLFVEPFRLARGKESSYWLKLLSGEIFFRVQEKSQGDDRLGVLTFRKRLDADTVYGTLEQSYALKVLPVNPRFTSRLRYRDIETLDRTLSYTDRHTHRKTYSAEFSSELLRDVSLTGSVERFEDTEDEIEENAPQYDKSAKETVYTLEPGYRVIQPWEIKLEGSYGVRNELNDTRPTGITTQRIKPNTTYRLPESGLVSAYYEMENNVVSGSEATTTLLTRLPGTTHRWETSVIKGVGEYITLIFTYTGFKEPDDETVHRGRIDLNIVF